MVVRDSKYLDDIHAERKIIGILDTDYVSENTVTLPQAYQKHY